MMSAMGLSTQIRSHFLRDGINHRNCDRVSELTIVLHIGYGINIEVFWEALQPCAFAWRQLARVPPDVRLIDQDFTAVLVVPGTNCVAVAAIAIEKAKAETVTFFLVTLKSTLVPRPKAIGQSVLRINRGVVLKDIRKLARYFDLQKII